MQSPHMARKGRRLITSWFPIQACGLRQVRSNAIARSGERELALDLIPQQDSGTNKRHKILRSLRRGREFARRVCFMTMHSWSSQFLGIDLNQKYENRKSQTNRANNARVLAA